MKENTEFGTLVWITIWGQGLHYTREKQTDSPIIHLLDRAQSFDFLNLHNKSNVR